jgi:cytochrome c-type biogenesis protein CcmF
VAHYSSRDLPTFYAISAFWAGQSGSLLLWGWLLALFAAVVVLQNRDRNRPLMPAVVGVLSGIELFFLVLMVFLSSPFQRLPSPLPDGHGLNPMLQNPGMIFHPPALYLGYVGFSVPFAFAIAALLTGRLDEGWIRTTRRWTLFSWFALTLGNLFGAQWAYVELGWGGYWAWDPVENASLIPWLTGTAFLHSVMIQEKRGMLKVWNVALIALTFALTIFGTFITRSGIISSVHSFGVSSLGPVFVVFLGVTVAGSIWLIYSRREMLRSRNQIEAILSREASFLFNNLLLVGMAFATFWGTVFPIVSEAVTGNKITVGPPFFNEVNLPIGLALLLLTGVCPLIAWRRSTGDNLRRNFLIPGGVGLLTGVGLLLLGVRDGYALLTFSLAAFVLTTIFLEFYRGARVRMRAAEEGAVRALTGLVGRNRRRYGGYIIHVGVALVFAGIAGSAFNRQVQARLKPGESAAVKDYTLTYERPVTFQERNKSVIAAEMTAYRNGQQVGRLVPEKAFYPQHGQPVSEVAIRSGFYEDLYVVLEGLDEEGTGTFQVFVNPLVGWLWAGGWMMALGTAVAIWPDRRRPRPSRLRAEESGPRREVAVASTAVALALALLLWAGPAGATPTVDEVAAGLACRCGCGMTAGNCTHDGCGSVTAIKKEVGEMLRAGRSKDEILAAFAAQYGDQALAAPPKRGFNLTAWILPFAAIGVGGLGLYAILSRWTSERRRPAERPVRPVDPKYAARLEQELKEFE